jgi:putative IMPACT (imprinted ancient) family translation regulator
MHTLTGTCRHQQEIKKSRFLATAAAVNSAEQALAFVHEVADADATHNCWAYRIGQDYRFNDDGEPGGTAGRPILQAIEGQGTAAECLRRAERMPIVAMATLAVHCNFAELALLKARLKDWQADIHSEIFDLDGVQLQLQLPESRIGEAQARIVDISRGHSTAKRLD